MGILYYLNLPIGNSPVETFFFLKIKAHEVRALSSSWAFFDKVPFNEILKAAVWNQSSSFAKFYLRNITSSKSPDFGPNSCCPKSGRGQENRLTASKAYGKYILR